MLKRLIIRLAKLAAIGAALGVVVSAGATALLVKFGSARTQRAAIWLNWPLRPVLGAVGDWVLARTERPSVPIPDGPDFGDLKQLFALGETATNALPVIDETALPLLKKVETTMIGLKSFQAESWTRSTSTFPSRSNRPSYVFYEMVKITVAKPNLMRVEDWALRQPKKSGEAWARSIEPFRIFVCDGKTNWWQLGKRCVFTTNSQPEKVDELFRIVSDNYYRNVTPWDGFFATNSSPFAQVKSCKERGTLIELRREGSEMVEGVACEKVFVRHKETREDFYGEDEDFDYREIWYVAGDGLVRRKVERVQFSGWANLRDTRLRNIRLNEPPPNAALFSFKPPKDAKEYAREAPRPSPYLKAGTAAPDFMATDCDGRPVKLSDFRGKVVVLFFWAAWNDSSVGAMRNFQPMMEKLRDENLPVVMLAVDAFDGRSTFQNWVAKHPQFDAIRFAHLEEKDHLHDKLYRVDFPCVQYVIDAQGIVRASMGDFFGKKLEKAIRTALAAK